MRTFEPIYFAPQHKLGGGWLCWKDSPSAPAAPDYTGAAQAQGAANLQSAQQTAVLSNPNVSSPYGSQSVTYSDGPNGLLQPNITQSLSPEQQSLLNSQNQVKQGLANLGQQGIGTVQNVMGTPFSFGGPGVQTGLDTSGVAKMPVNAGTTGQEAIMARLNPQLERSRAAMENRDANQGITRGSEAYATDQTLQGQQENDARSQAALQGIGLDMSANNQGYNQALQSGQFGNTAQQQMLAQALQKYNLPLNQVTALMSGSQVTNPQFQGYTGSSVAPSPVANAAAQQGQYGQNLYGQQMGAANANTSGLYGLGSSALMYAALA